MNARRNWLMISASLMILSAFALPLTTALADAPPSVPHTSRPDPPLAPGKPPSTATQLPPAEQKALDAQHQIDAALEQLGYLIETGHAQDAVPDLIKLKSMPREKDDPSVQALIAQVALTEKKPDAAWQIIKPWSEHAKLIHPELVRPWLAVGDVYMAKQQYDKALKHFDWLTAGLSKIDPKTAGISPAQWAEELALSAEGCGMACFYLDRDKDAQDSLKFALKVATTRLPHPKDHDKWLIDRLRAELAMAAPSEDVKKYGEDYVLFRNAEIQRRISHQPKKALDTYDKLLKKFPKSAFAAPAALGNALTLVELDRIPEAETQLEHLYQSDKTGLYAGNALLELGRIAMEYHVNPDMARKYFSLLDEWFVQARKPGAFDKDDAAPMKAETVKISTPPATEKTHDYFGTAHLQPVAPGDLLNAKTAPWYLDRMEATAVEFEAFLEFCKGDKDPALKSIKRVLELDPEARQMQDTGQVNTYWRLKTGFTAGFLSARPEELSLYAGQQKFAVLLADLYELTEQFDKGEAVFRRLLKGDFGKLSSGQQAYIHFGLGNCLYRGHWAGGNFAARQPAIEEYRKAMLVDSTCLTHYRAGVAFFNIGRQSVDKKTREEAQATIEAMAASNVKNEWTEVAKVNLAMSLMHAGRKQQAISVLNRITKDDGDFYGLSRYLIAKFEKEPAPATQPGGK